MSNVVFVVVFIFVDVVVIVVVVVVIFVDTVLSLIYAPGRHSD